MTRANDSLNTSDSLACTRCGTEVSDTDRFCAECGATIAGDTPRVSQHGSHQKPSGDSISEILSQPTTQDQLKYILGLYAIVGVGLGLVGALGIEMITGSDEGFGAALMGGLFGLTALGITLFIGPIMAAFSGLSIADRMQQTRQTVYVTSFVGNTAGYLAMVFLAVLMLAAFASGGSDGGGGGDIFSLGDLFVPLMVLAIPSGLVGLGSTYLHLRLTRGSETPAATQ